jgi:hypothetical protein
MSKTYTEKFNIVVNEMNKLWNNDIDLNQSFSENMNIEKKVSAIKNKSDISSIIESKENNHPKENFKHDSIKENNLEKEDFKENNPIKSLKEDFKENNPIDSLKEDESNSIIKEQNIQKDNNDIDFLEIGNIYTKLEQYLDEYMKKKNNNMSIIQNDDIWNELSNQITESIENKKIDNKEMIYKYKENYLNLYILKKINRSKVMENSLISKGNKYNFMILLIFVLIIIPRFIIFLYHK